MITPRALLAVFSAAIRDRLSATATPQTCLFASLSPIAFFRMIRNDAYKPISDIAAVAAPRVLGIGERSITNAMPLSRASVLTASPKRAQNKNLFIF